MEKKSYSSKPTESSGKKRKNYKFQCSVCKKKFVTFKESVDHVLVTRHRTRTMIISDQKQETMVEKMEKGRMADSLDTILSIVQKQLETRSAYNVSEKESQEKIFQACIDRANFMGISVRPYERFWEAYQKKGGEGVEEEDSVQ